MGDLVFATLGLFVPSGEETLGQLRERAWKSMVETVKKSLAFKENEDFHEQVLALANAKAVTYLKNLVQIYPHEQGKLAFGMANKPYELLLILSVKLVTLKEESDD